jgi:hypothetical protein
VSNGLSEWSGRRGPDVRQAMIRLESLPQARHGVRPPPPLVVDQKDRYHQACARAGNGGHLSPEIKRAPIEVVQLDGVHTIQGSVNPTRVLQYLRDPELTPRDAVGPHGGPVGYPIVVRAGGIRWLHDGHHRVVANLLRGERSIRARYLDLDARTPNPGLGVR